MFVVLPNVFDKIPGGMVFGAGFFVLLGIAALTSSISLLEVVVAYLIDERGWSRRRAVAVAGSVAFAVGVPIALSHGASGALTHLPVVGRSLFDLADAAFGSISLTVGGLLLSVFVGWRWGVPAAAAEIGFRAEWLRRAWAVLIRWVCPAAIAALLVNVLVHLA
jgi:NSS family neurotransmitter:Na+ symporter